MPCVAAARRNIEALSAAVIADPSLEVVVDVEGRCVRYGDQSFAVDVVESARESLINGKWDPIAELLEGEQAVEQAATALDYMNFQR